MENWSKTLSRTRDLISSGVVRLYERTNICYSTRTGIQPKRSRLADRKLPWGKRRNIRSLALIIISVIQVCLLSGCGASSQVRDAIERPSKASPLAHEIRLEIDESSLKWGDCQLGTILKERLVENKTFTKVHYPIYPPHTDPLKLKVVAHGNKDEDSTGFLKAFFTGLLLFLPVGIIQYEDNFTVSVDMWVNKKERVLGPVKISSVVEVRHTLFSKAERYTPDARAKGFADLANRIITELRNQEDWFFKNS